MKIAVYCRVSTEEQTTENQRIRLLEHCERHGWDPEVIEEVESSRGGRPKKQLLLQRLRDKEFDGVLVWKLDRWARSSRELILEMEELRRLGVAFYSKTENLDLSTSTGQLHFTILAAFAQFERDLISERTREGLHRAKAQGKKLGRPLGAKDHKERRKSGYYARYIAK